MTILWIDVFSFLEISTICPYSDRQFVLFTEHAYVTTFCPYHFEKHSMIVSDRTVSFHDFKIVEFIQVYFLSFWLRVCLVRTHARIKLIYKCS